MFYWNNNIDPTIDLNNRNLSGEQQGTNWHHSNGQVSDTHRAFNNHNNNNQFQFSNQITPNQFRPRNNHSSKKENGTWECNVCHKIFRQRKGFYQHINSNTHQPIKHSCSLCGKGFASLGALALHNEQASHANLNDDQSNNSTDVTTTSDVSTFSMPVKSPQSVSAHISYNLKSFHNGPTNNNDSLNTNFPNRTNNNNNNNNRNSIIPQNYPTPYSSQMPLNVPPSSVSSNSFEFFSSSTRLDLFVGGMIDFPSKVGAYGWAIGDVTCDKVLFQHAVTIIDCQWTIEQLEYQALLHGLKTVHSKGMKMIQIRECSQATVSHLMNEAQQNSTDALKQLELGSFKADVLQLFPLFEQITFEMHNSGGFIESIITKAISDCIMRLSGSSCVGNIQFNFPSNINNDGKKNSANMIYNLNQFISPAVQQHSQQPHVWQQPSHMLPISLSASANEFSPSMAGESSFLLNMFGEDVSKTNNSVTSTSSDISDYSRVTSLTTPGSHYSSGAVQSTTNVTMGNNRNTSTGTTDVSNVVSQGLQQNFYRY